MKTKYKSVKHFHIGVGIFFAIVAIFFPTFATANHLNVEYKVYIPHLTGNTLQWNDVLVANNKGPLLQTFTLTLFNEGLQVAQESFLVQPNEERDIDIKSIDMDATLGVVDYHSQYLTFRMDYRNLSGGVAEFRLNDKLYEQAFFNFTNIFPDVIAGKGIAVANFENFAANVTLHAIGANRQVLGSEVVSLNRRSRIVGLHTAWFPGVPLENIVGIVVSSTEAKIGGITISSNTGGNALLFTQSADASTFTQENTPEQIMIEDYWPVGQFEYTGTKGVTMDYSLNNQEIQISIFIDDFFFKGFIFTLDQQGNLRYKTSMNPYGQKWTNTPFELIPGEADLNRSFEKIGTWDQINAWWGNSSNVTGVVEVSIEGPFYTLVEAGTFPSVIKVGIVDKALHQNTGNAHLDFVAFWLSEEFGIVKAIINGLEFEMVMREEQ